MPKYECKPCSFSTSDKPKYARHIKTSKHLIKCNSNTYCSDDDSIKSSVTESSVSSSVLLEEMRNLMKQQNIQRENDRLAFEEQKKLYEKQIEQQQLQIDFLKNMLNQQANTQINTQASINTNVNKIVEQTTPFCRDTFLNETCKYAINLDDFILSITVSYDDYMTIFDYVKQVSNKIIEEVNKLGEKKRPIHCFDSRRKVFYIKQNNEWNRCDENDQLIKRLIFTIQKKYSDYICVYLERNPNYLKSNKMCDEHMARVLQIVDEDNKDKILRTIMNAICIVK
jgi:hypothetical protein